MYSRKSGGMEEFKKPLQCVSKRQIILLCSFYTVDLHTGALGDHANTHLHPKPSKHALDVEG